MKDSQPNYFRGYMYEGPFQRYDYLEVTVSGGVTNLKVEPSIQARYLDVSVSGANIKMKINGTDSPDMSILASANKIIPDFAFTNLYFSNSSGSNAVVSLFMMGYR